MTATLSENYVTVFVLLPITRESTLKAFSFFFLLNASKNETLNLKEFYDKKKSEGKPAKVAIVACINKLLHWIYALLNRK